MCLIILKDYIKYFFLLDNCSIGICGFLIFEIICFYVNGIDDGYSGYVGYVLRFVGGEGYFYCEGID